jgi:hypothetical protein
VLDPSFQYVQGKRAFETAITSVRRRGWPDEEIARVTGLPVEMIETVAAAVLADALDAPRSARTLERRSRLAPTMPGRIQRRGRSLRRVPLR